MLDKDEYEKFKNRIALFKKQTGFAGGIVPTFITVNGLQRNSYSEHIVAQITLDDLFEKSK